MDEHDKGALATAIERTRPRRNSLSNKIKNQLHFQQKEVVVEGNHVFEVKQLMDDIRGGSFRKKRRIKKDRWLVLNSTCITIMNPNEEVIQNIPWTSIRNFRWDLNSYNFEAEQVFCFQTTQGPTIEKVKDSIIKNLLGDEDNQPNSPEQKKKSDYPFLSTPQEEKNRRHLLD